MDIWTATNEYESWLADHTTLLKEHLDIKHEHMAMDVFLFLRATFYRWAQVWPQVCDDIAQAPSVLAVGDLHVENFGTWRDSEGRLIWGCNDFDEAWELPYTNDLVRLATSAAFAIKADHLKISFKDACKSLLKGYRDSLKKGGQPFVLAEDHDTLRGMATADLREPVHFWKEKMAHLPTYQEDIPEEAVKNMEADLPQPGLPGRICTRIAGNGSLGHQRFVRIADWQGGQIAREAKALVPSACAWASGSDANNTYSQDIIDRAVRCKDPFVKAVESWVIRRLAPDCSAIEVGEWPGKKDDERLLYSMGWETANIHLGTPANTAAILQDLKSRKSSWLRYAAGKMTKTTCGDWNDWRKAYKKRKKSK